MKDEKGSFSGLVKVFTARQYLDAEMVKAILEDEGIPAIVKDFRLYLAIGWPLQYPGFDVLVPADQAEEARMLLESGRGPDWACPKCGEKIDGVFDACWKCGHEREKG